MSKKDDKTTTESPLAKVEKEIEEFKKELEGKHKTLSKIEFKTKNFDRAKYKNDIAEAQADIEQLNKKCNEFVVQLNELKKEFEAPTLKQKDFDSRKEKAASKIKDLLKKNEKLSAKFKADLAKLQKIEADEEKKANKGNSSTTISAIASAMKPDKEKFDEANKNLTAEKTTTPAASPKDDKKTAKKDKTEKTVSEKPDSNAQGGGGGGLSSLMANLAAKKSETDTQKKDRTENDIEEESYESEDEEDEEDEADENDIQEHKESAAAKVIASIGKKENDIPDGTLKTYEKTMEGSEGEEEEESEDDDDDDVKMQPKKPVSKLDINNTVADILTKGKGKEPEEIKPKPKPKEEEKPKPKEEEKKIIYKSDEEDEDEEEEIDDTLDEMTGPKTPSSAEFKPGTQFVTLLDFEGEQEGDLGFKKDEILSFIRINDANWWLMKNSKGREGFVFKDDVRIVKSEMRKLETGQSIESTTSTRSGLDLWNLVKESVQNKTLLDPEALKAAGYLPNSFSNSTLQPLSIDPNYSYSKYLEPKLAESNLSFKNFFWESKENKVRSRIVTFQKVFMINKCTHIPIPKEDELKVLDRFVRISLFDGKSILSNVHIVRGHVAPKDPGTWLFSNYINDFVGIIECSEFFVRCQTPTEKSNLGVLFELSMHCQKIKTNEETHVCCGWVHIPFIDELGNGIANKGYDLILNGGNIYSEKGMPVNPNVARARPNSTLLDNLIDKLFRESKIKFDVSAPNAEFSSNLNSLPEPLISGTLLAQYMKYYTEDLGAHVLKPLIDTGTNEIDTSPIHSPFLSTFIKALDNPDVMTAVHQAFIRRKEMMKRDQRHDESFLRKTYIELFTQIAYPLVHHGAMPKLELHNADVMESRDTLIERHLQSALKNAILRSLLSETEEFQPFDIEELTYQPLNTYSGQKTHVV